MYMSTDPKIRGEFGGRLRDDVIEGICSELKKEGRVTDEDVHNLDNPQAGFPIELSDSALTGEGMAAYEGQRIMRKLGLEPQLPYQTKSPRYYLGMMMWESVIEHAEKQGIRSGELVELLLKPYQRSDGSQGLTGVVELFEGRENLRQFIE